MRTQWKRVTVVSSLYFFFLLDIALVFLWGSKSIAHRYQEAFTYSDPRLRTTASLPVSSHELYHCPAWFGYLK